MGQHTNAQCNNLISQLGTIKYNLKSAISHKGQTITDATTFAEYSSKVEAIQVAKEEEAKSATYTSNGTYSITPTSGKVISGATVTVNVQQGYKPEETCTQTITSNGTQTFNPTTGSVFDKAVITTDVHPTNTLSETYTTNGTKTVSGEFNGGTIVVNVPTPEPVLQSKDVEPSTEVQYILPDEGYDGLEEVKVDRVEASIDPNIVAGNIKKDVSILGVTGTYDNQKPEESKTATYTSNGTYTISPTSGSVISSATVTVNVPTTGSFEINNTNNVKLGNSGFTSIPAGLTFNTTDWSNMFSSCASLTTVSGITTTGATNMNYMFYGCNQLTSVSLFDTSTVTSMSYMFNNCNNLTTVPAFNLSNVSDASYMYNACSSLTSIPTADYSGITNMRSTFDGCSALSSVGNLDISSATNIRGLFGSCSALTTVGVLDTSAATDLGNIFWNPNSLTTVNGIDFSSATAADQLFGFEYSSTTHSLLTHFIVTSGASINISMSSFKTLNNIDYDSIKSILTAASNTTNSNAKTLEFNRTITDQGGELAALVATCTASDKNWTITGLTLQ